MENKTFLECSFNDLDDIRGKNNLFIINNDILLLFYRRIIDG